MLFVAVTSTDDGRLTKGEIYQGGFVGCSITGTGHPRIIVFDNKGEWMTFNPAAFKPMELR